MPKSKRNKVVSLTKTTSKGKNAKAKLIEEIHESIDSYSSVFLFSFDNMRSTVFKDVRMHFKESRLYLGKNSVAQVALGKTVETEYKDNLRRISERMEGNTGLLFTNRPKNEVIEYFKTFQVPEFAKAGAVLEDDITIEPGPLTGFPSSMLNQFRQLGLVVEIEDGVIVLKNKFDAAVKDRPLTPEQAKMLVHLGMKTIIFSIELLMFWKDGELEELA